MSYISTADEPASSTRLVRVTVYQVSYNSSCSIPVDIVLVNDNMPVVDLNGLDVPGVDVNVSTSFNHNFLTRVRVASSAELADQDKDGRIQVINISLVPGMTGDRLVFDEDVCINATNEDTCYLRLVSLL